MNNHLWVTQYEPGELNAAGYYINQSKGGEGLPKWTRANRAIENQDIVLWYLSSALDLFSVSARCVSFIDHISRLNSSPLFI
jgi:hypothetical protein